MVKTLLVYLEFQVQEKVVAAIVITQIIKIQLVQIKKARSNLKRRTTITRMGKMNPIHLKFKEQEFNKSNKIMMMLIIKIGLIQEY